MCIEKRCFSIHALTAFLTIKHVPQTLFEAHKAKHMPERHVVFIIKKGL